jgi:DNA-binding NarL/FixJ family response regulator
MPTTATYDELENIVRRLLETFRGSTDIAFDRQSAVQVKVDGRPYLIYIVEGIEEKPDEAETSNLLLSPREMDIARLIVDGLPTKLIASSLGLRPCTVSTYSKRIYLKLNVNSRAGLVAKLLREYPHTFQTSCTAYPTRLGRSLRIVNTSTEDRLRRFSRLVRR